MIIMMMIVMALSSDGLRGMVPSRYQNHSTSSVKIIIIQYHHHHHHHYYKVSYAKEGQVLLRAAQAAGIELEGACEGVCACSTCHVILPEDIYDHLPDPSEDEEDMLDQAFGLTSTSRLGCQIKLNKKDHDNILIKIPSATRNFYVDGHVPKPH